RTVPRHRSRNLRRAFAVRESQRDPVPKPRVARHELPWVTIHQTSTTATRLRPFVSIIAYDGSHNPVGVVALHSYHRRIRRNPVGVVPIANRDPRSLVPRNLGLEVTLPLGLRGPRLCDPQHLRCTDRSR